MNSIDDIVNKNSNNIFDVLYFSKNNTENIINGVGFILKNMIENLFGENIEISDINEFISTLKEKDLNVDPFIFYNKIYLILNENDDNKKFFIYIIYSSLVAKKPIRFLIIDLINKIDSSLSFSNDFQFCISLYKFLFENNYKNFDIHLKGSFIVFLMNSILENTVNLFEIIKK